MFLSVQVSEGGSCGGRWWQRRAVGRAAGHGDSSHTLAGERKSRCAHGGG